MPNVSYREKADLPEKYRWLYDTLEQVHGVVNNVFRALAHSPQMLRGVMVVGNTVLNRSSLDPRVRELAIIRVGQILGADYERTHHIEIGKQVGVTDADLENLATWDQGSHFGAFEKAIFKYTDEITRLGRPEPGTIEALKPYFDEEGLILLFTSIGFYNMMCRVLNSVNPDLEPDFEKYRNVYR